MKTRHISLVALALLLLWAATVNAQSTHFTLGLGYQWVDLKGNEDMYRSQVNEDDGLVLDNLSMSLANAGGTSVRVDAAGFGGNPQGRLRIESALAKVYRLRLGYMRAEHFSALPMLANPFLGRGVVPGQHTLDRRFENVDLDVEFFPGGAFTPVVGYTRTRHTGPGRTTVFAGQDEFSLVSDLHETVQEFRAGLNFNVAGFGGSVIQGWRQFDLTEEFELAAGAGGGNNSRPVLGRDVSLAGTYRRNESKGNTPFTNIRVAGRLGDRARLIGSFARAGLDSESRETESLSGNLASFELARFFSRRTETATGDTNGSDWRGEARIEAEVLEGIEFSAGYTGRHRELDGAELISSLYSGTVNFSGFDPRDISTLLDATNAMERNEKALELTASLSNLGPARFWLSFARANEDITVTPDVAQVVVPGGQGGAYEREVNRTSAGVDLDFGDLALMLDLRSEEADKTVVRTDFEKRDRWRVRGKWDLAKAVHVVGTAEKLDYSNTATGVGLDGSTKRWGLSINAEPTDALAVRFGYDLFRSDSQITVRIPQPWGLDESIYHEDGEAFDGGLTYHRGGFSFDAGYTQYKNGGMYALVLNRTYARCDLDFTDRIGAGMLFDARDFNQPGLAIAQYDAKRYTLLLRWHQ